MALPFMNIIAPPRPGEIEKRHPKRSWKRVAIGVVLIAVAIFAYWGVFYANWFREGPAEAIPGTIPPTVTVTATPLTIPPTTEPVVVPPVVTTTTSMTTTTAVPTTTTTTLSPEERIAFNWGGEPAPLGLLTGRDGEGHLGFWYGVSGDLVDIYQREVDVLGEPTQVRFLKFSFGENPATGEKIIADLFLGYDGIDIYRVFNKPYWVPFDPTAPERAQIGLGGTRMQVEEFIELLEVGVRYPMKLTVDVDMRPIEDCSNSWCVFSFEELFNSDVYDALGYNTGLIEMMRGTAESPAPEEFGWVSSIYFVSPPPDAWGS